MKPFQGVTSLTHKGVELRIEFTHYPFIGGSHDSLGGIPGAGPALEPDEPEHVEIEKVTIKEQDGWDLVNDNEWIEEIEEKILGELQKEED